MRTRPQPPEVAGTIIFLTVAGEEQNLYGSAHFAQMARAQGWNIVAALNNDIVGGSRSTRQRPGVVRVFSEGLPAVTDERQLQQLRRVGGESDSASRELARQIVEVATTYRLRVRPLMIFRADRYLRGGDHQSFTQQGFPAVRFTEYLEDFDREHQDLRVADGIEYGDLSKFVDFDYVAGVARIDAATLASLAAAPESPVAAKLDIRGLGNGSTLRWERVANATSYEVLWRDTSSPDWQHALNTWATSPKPCLTCRRITSSSRYARSMPADITVCRWCRCPAAEELPGHGGSRPGSIDRPGRQECGLAWTSGQRF